MKEKSPVISTTGLFTKEPYTIHYVESKRCWTYKNSRGYSPGISSKFRQCPNPETTYEQLQFDDKILSAQEDGSPIDRKTYELLCFKFSLEPREDEKISKSYGTRFGNFSWYHHGLDTCVAEALAYRRLKDLDDISSVDNSTLYFFSSEKYYGNELICTDNPLYEF
jgi:hypothetical protein